MKIAIIGTGIAGMVSARELAREHEITVFEANDYVGGHTNTIAVDLDGNTYAIDTGFIVYNDWTYPNFIALLERLGVTTQPSDMTFSVRCRATGIEYNGRSLDALYAQRTNILRPRFHRMLLDILRFNRQAIEYLAVGGGNETLGQFLRQGNFRGLFVSHYIVPMGAAIWSTDPKLMYDFPARYFLSFFKNHGLLSVKDRPQWRVIKGGSWRYVEKLVAPFKDRIRLSTPVTGIRRTPLHVCVNTEKYGIEHFDKVVLACHSDQALAMLEDPSIKEQEILGAIRYQDNEAVLHTDESVLPRRRKVWAAWNYHLPKNGEDRVALTYNMNILQNIGASRQFCVTLNDSQMLDPARIIRRISYAHPLYDPAGVAARVRQDEINGAGNTWYCGAYWGYGFHEDGVNSALKVCEQIRNQHRHEQQRLPRTG